MCVWVRERLLIVARTPLLADRVCIETSAPRCQVNIYCDSLIVLRSLEHKMVVLLPFVCASARVSMFSILWKVMVRYWSIKADSLYKTIERLGHLLQNIALRDFFFPGVFPYFHRSGSVARREFFFHSLLIVVNY